MCAPFYFGLTTSRNLMPGRDKVTAGFIDGMLIAARVFPDSGTIALKVGQTTAAPDRPHGSIGYVVMFQTGMMVEVAA